MKKYLLKLDLFDEGAGAGAAEGSGQSVTGGDATTTVEEGATDGQQQQDTLEAEYNELIKGKYKAQADKHIQGIVNKRFKANKEMESKLKAQSEILGIYAGKYGVDANDLDALKAAAMGDDSIFEERAIEQGLTVDQFKRIEELEAKNRQFQAQQAQAEQEARAQEQVRAWQEQADQVKTLFPDFNLQNELQNETFRKQLQLGIDMQSAFVAAHQAEILQGSMSYTAQQVRAAAAKDIAARGTRPAESVQSRRSTATVNTDVSKLTREDREKLSRRAAAGEIISFS